MKKIDRRKFTVLGVTALTVAALPFSGAHGKMTQGRMVNKPIDQLEPGDFVWHPEQSPKGPVAVIVSLPDQLVHVYRNGVRIAVSTCSTGKKGTARRRACSPSCKRTSITIHRPTTTRQCRT